MLAIRNLRNCLRGAQLFEKQVFGSIGMMQGEASGLVQTAGVSGTAAAPGGATGSVYNVGAATNIKFHDGMVPRTTKEKLMDQRGVIIWFTGERRPNFPRSERYFNPSLPCFSFQLIFIIFPFLFSPFRPERQRQVDCGVHPGARVG
jgi:hypothetical protein